MTPEEVHDLMLERGVLLEECAKLRDIVAEALDRVAEIDRLVAQDALPVGYTNLSHSRRSRTRADLAA